MHHFYPPVSPARRELPRPLVILLPPCPLPRPPDPDPALAPDPRHSQPVPEGSEPADPPTIHPWLWLVTQSRWDPGSPGDGAAFCCSGAGGKSTVWGRQPGSSHGLRFPGEERVFIGTDGEDLGRARASRRTSPRRRGTEIAEAQGGGRGEPGLRVLHRQQPFSSPASPASPAAPPWSSPTSWLSRS